MMSFLELESSDANECQLLQPRPAAADRWADFHRLDHMISM